MIAFFNRHKRACVATAAVIGFYGLLFAMGITCPIKYISGVSCPGCGMSRACLSAVCLDFRAAFHYHPLWVLLLPFGIAFGVLAAKKKRLALRICIVAAALLMVAVYLWRMLAGGGDIVLAEPQNGLIGRLITTIFD